MALLVIPKPQTHILVVVHEVVCAVAVLLVLEPFAVIFLSVGEGIDSVSLSFAFDVLPFVGVAVLVSCQAFAVGLSCLHLSSVGASVSRLTCAERYLLCICK